MSRDTRPGTNTEVRDKVSVDRTSGRRSRQGPRVPVDRSGRMGPSEKTGEG